jgi:hypothetical protein
MGLKLIGTWVIKTNRGMEWDKYQIRVSQKGLGPPKKGFKNEGYHCDQNEERNPMDQVSNKGATGPHTIFFLIPWCYTLA